MNLKEYYRYGKAVKEVRNKHGNVYAANREILKEMNKHPEGSVQHEYYRNLRKANIKY